MRKPVKPNNHPTVKATCARVPVRNSAKPNNFDHRLYYLLSAILSIEKPRQPTESEASERRNSDKAPNLTPKLTDLTGYTNTTSLKILVVIITLLGFASKGDLVIGNHNHA